MIYNLYKERGETPLERIQRFAKSKLGLRGEKMTYIGRLDPLAEGVLLMASGDDVKRKEEFIGLDKEYDFVCLFGFETDSFDVLGKITRMEKLENLSENDVRKVAQIYVGEREQKYPLFSSKVFASSLTPLQKRGGTKQNKHSQHCSREQISERDWRESEEIFQQKNTPVVRENNADYAEIDLNLPTKKIIIHKIDFLGLDTLNNKELFGRLLMDISKVKGDFRQHEILILWREILSKCNLNIFLGRFSAHVSSGTYIRSLVNDIGKTLGCGATVLSIKRNRVGDFKIEDSIK